MSGLLSTIFDGGTEGAATPAAGSQDDAHAPSATDTHATDASAHAGPAVHVSPHIHVEESGSYTAPDGSTTQWSHSNDVGLHVDDAASITAAAAAATQAVTDHG